VGWWQFSTRIKRASCRSETSLIQTIGRAARNAGRRVIIVPPTAFHRLDERAWAKPIAVRAKQVALTKSTGITPDKR